MSNLNDTPDLDAIEANARHFVSAETALALVAEVRDLRSLLDNARGVSMCGHHDRHVPGANCTCYMGLGAS